MINATKLETSIAELAADIKASEGKRAVPESAYVSLECMRIILAAQATPGELEATCELHHNRSSRQLGTADWRDLAETQDKKRKREIMQSALLAAALHRPVEARVTEETASAEIEKRMNELVDLLAVFMDTKIDDRAWGQLLVYAPSSLPNPQVTLDEVYSLIMKHEKSTFGHIAWPRLLADRILALFGKKTA